MKKVHRGILIWHVLLVTAAIFTSLIDVFLGIEMADAGTHRIKIANSVSILRQEYVFKTRLQDLKKNSSLNSNDMVLKTTTILFILLMFAWPVWGRYNFYRLRRSAGRGKLPNILESKNQLQQLAVLIYFPEMPSKLGQFSGTPVDISLLLNHK